MSPHPCGAVLTSAGRAWTCWVPWGSCQLQERSTALSTRSPLPGRVSIDKRPLIVSWQEALQDKGYESKSQGTKEEKLAKRPAPAPRREREAPEAGGSAMNVEKTGKGGLPGSPAPWPG